MIHSAARMAVAWVLALLALGCPVAGQFCASDYTTLTVFQLRTFMETPFSPVWDSAEGIVSGDFAVVGSSTEPVMSDWFLHQIRVHEAVGAGFMIYAGFENGVFSGYGLSGDQDCSKPGQPPCTIWYTQRKANRARPTAYADHWQSYAGRYGAAAPWQESPCATGRSGEPFGCRADTSKARSCTDPLTCRAFTTTGGTTCAFEAACKTQKQASGAWTTQAGAYLADDCNSAGTASTSIAFAQQTCGHADCVDVSTSSGHLPGCQDYDVRVYYQVGCGAGDLQEDQDMCEASGTTCSVTLPAAFSLRAVSGVGDNGGGLVRVTLSVADATTNVVGQKLTLGDASGSSAVAIVGAAIASIDDGAANSVTLASADATIAAGQVLQLSDAGGQTCAAAPKGSDLVVASVDGAVITFATALTAGDTGSNCVLSRAAPCLAVPKDLVVASVSGAVITTSTTLTTADATGNCVISRAQDEAQCTAYSGAWVAPCSYTAAIAAVGIVSIDAGTANSVTLGATDATILAGHLLQLVDKSGQTCAATPKGPDLVVASASGAVITFTTDLTVGDASANTKCEIARVSSCANAGGALHQRTPDSGPHMKKPYRWRNYDARYRMWYNQAKSNHVSSGLPESWSDLYTFASGQGIGLSAMRVVTADDSSWCEGDYCSNCAAAGAGEAACRGTDDFCTGGSLATNAAATQADCEALGGTWVEPCVYDAVASRCSGTSIVGVLAVDYSLDTLRNWLRSVIPLSDNLVVWIVDQKAGLETSAGTILAASEGEGLEPTTHTNYLLKRSAEYLTEKFGSYEDWPSMYSNSTVPDWLATTDGGESVRQVNIEVQSLGDTRGLQWLVVVAAIQHRTCERPKQADPKHLKCECKPSFRSTLAADILRAEENNDLDCILCKSYTTICCAESEAVGQRCAVSTAQKEAGCINCHGGDRVTAKKGFFVDGTAGQDLRVFRCLDHLCLGLDDSVNDTGTPRCPPEAENITNGNCCLKGHTGSLCGICKENYVWSDDMICVPCTSPNALRLFMIVASLLVFSCYSVLSKHYMLIKKESKKEYALKRREDYDELALCNCFGLSFFIPRGTDLPATGGSEMQTITFWMQSFTLLDIDGAGAWWWVLSMLFQFSPTKGVKVCPFNASPYEKWFADVFGPIIFLCCSGFVLHCCVCAHMAYRQGTLPCQRASSSRTLHVRGISGKLDDEKALGELFTQHVGSDRVRVTRVVIRHRVKKREENDAKGVNASWALVMMSGTVPAVDILKKMKGDDRCNGLQIEDFNTDIAAKSKGAMTMVMAEVPTFRRHLKHQHHKLQAVFLDIIIYSLMPIMTKSLIITHCRFDTPDGAPRVIRLPEIECAGALYNFTNTCAVLLYLGLGFAFPLWLGWKLFLRVDAPTAELEHHSIWVGDPEYHQEKDTIVNAEGGIGEKFINLLECITQRDLDHDGDIGGDGDSNKVRRMWRRLFSEHISAARAGHPSNEEIIKAWEFRAGSEAVLNSGVFSAAKSEHGRMHRAVTIGGDVIGRSLKGIKERVKKQHTNDNLINFGEGAYKEETENMKKARNLEPGQVLRWVKENSHAQGADLGSIDNNRSALRKERHYETLIRWAYEDRISEVFATGLTQNLHFEKAVKQHHKSLQSLDTGDVKSDRLSKLSDAQQKHPILTVQLKMSKVRMAESAREMEAHASDTAEAKEFIDRLEKELEANDGLSEQEHLEKLHRRADKDCVAIPEEQKKDASVIIQAILEAHGHEDVEHLPGDDEEGHEEIFPSWCVIVFKQVAGADFALDVAATSKGLTSPRTGADDTKIVDTSADNWHYRHLQDILHDHPTALHAQEFDTEEAINDYHNRCVWKSAQTRLEDKQKRQAKKVVDAMHRVLDSIGSSLPRQDLGGEGRAGSYLRSVYWSTVASGARSRRDWLSPMYASVNERSWWWNAALLFRRTAVAMFSSRREGTRFQVFGTDSDWRAMVVLTLAINLFLSSIYLPYKERQTNYFSDFSIVMLLIMYMFTTSGETKFFLLVSMLAVLILIPSFLLLLWKKKKQRKKTLDAIAKMRATRVQKGVLAGFGLAGKISVQQVPLELLAKKIAPAAEAGDVEAGGVAAKVTFAAAPAPPPPPKAAPAAPTAMAAMLRATTPEVVEPYQPTAHVAAKDATIAAQAQELEVLRGQVVQLKTPLQILPQGDQDDMIARLRLEMGMSPPQSAPDAEEQNWRSMVDDMHTDNIVAEVERGLPADADAEDPALLPASPMPTPPVQGTPGPRTSTNP